MMLTVRTIPTKPTVIKPTRRGPEWLPILDVLQRQAHGRVGSKSCSRATCGRWNSASRRRNGQRDTVLVTLAAAMWLTDAGLPACTRGMNADLGLTQNRHLPLACTLGPEDGQARMRRWQQLHEDASPVARLNAGRLEVWYQSGPGVRAELSDLAAEQTCCSFVT